MKLILGKPGIHNFVSTVNLSSKLITYLNMTLSDYKEQYAATELFIILFRNFFKKYALMIS